MNDRARTIGTQTVRTRTTSPLADVARVDVEAGEVMARVARTFDVASRLLPAEVRVDVRRLYLVMRTLDDLVDHGDPTAAERLAAVERWASGGVPETREAALLADLAARHPTLPRDAVRDFCAGMQADLAGPRHTTEADLAMYCYRVAGTVGRLMAVLLGVTPGAEAEADRAARALGCAMQRTNILRDLVEDAEAGRVYLPVDALAAAGITPSSAADAIRSLDRWPAERRRALIAPQVARADADYERGLAGVGHLLAGRRAVAAAGAMYREILREIERDAHGGSRRRAVVPRYRKATLVARVMVFGR